MIIKRIGPLSCAKIVGLLYAFLGFLAGGLLSLFSLAGFVGGHTSHSAAGPFAALFGVAGIILFPLIYGALGFVIALISAAIYNVLAGIMGGIQLEVVPERETPLTPSVG